MAIQQITKEKVLNYMTKERRYLENTLSELTEEQINQPCTIDNISIKEYLAYLIGWERMMLKWIDAACHGDKPELPAPGMTWYYKDIHNLDRQFIRAFHNCSLNETLEEFQASYQTVVEIVDQIPEKIFIDAALIPRKDGGPLGRLIASNTAWHYRRAKTKIRKWMKEQVLL